jgi:hypothetical protein
VSDDVIIRAAPDGAWTDYVEGRRMRARRRRLEDLDEFRGYLRNGVRLASPLLADAVGMGIVDLRDVLRRMRPRPFTPDGGHHVWRVDRWRFLIASRSSEPISSRGFDGRHRWMAARLRGEHDRRGRLGVRVEAGTLAIEFGIGRHVVMTHEGVLRLHLRDAIPESIAAAVMGRPVDHLIGHPLLDGRPYEVTDVVMDGNDTLVTAKTGLVRIQLPEIQNAMRRGRWTE